MVVGPDTIAETLRAATLVIESPNRLHVDRSASGRPSRSWRTGSDSVPGGDWARLVAAMPGCRPRGSGRRAASAPITGCGTAACRGRWPTGSARSRSSRRWARGGFLGIFGAAGLSLAAVEHAIDRIQHGLGDSIPYGMNLIHSPGEPELESAVVDLLLRRGCGWSRLPRFST